jgi:predicted pyridoxine 5'-phosphate oxidase superfamily flavin-nucleotide-binding protein
MSDTTFTSDVAFTPTVKLIQARKGSRAAYERMERGAGWRRAISPDLAAFVARQTSFFIATANPAGQPYIQHRGGPPGFLKVIDHRTLGFADFRGNRQFITQGNLADNPRTMLFLVDYDARQRIKIWGAARVVENDPALITRLMPADYRATAEAAILVEVAAWDANCPSHIPRLVPAASPSPMVTCERARRRS